jgi:hypothetical protein
MFLVEKDLDESAGAPLSQMGWSFPKDPYAALGEVKQIISMSQEEVDMLLAVVAKSASSIIEFEVGHVNITFVKDNFYSELNLELEGQFIELRVEIEEESKSYSAKYRFPCGGKQTLSTIGDEGGTRSSAWELETI